jgi:hypothetical protein
MKSLSLFFAVTLTCLVIYPQHHVHTSQTLPSATSESPITVTLSTAGDRYKPGSPIPVVIAISNTGKVPVNLYISIDADGPYRSLGLRFDLRLSGQEVERTAFHRAIRGEARRGEPSGILSGRSDVYTMRPGQVEHINVDVMKLFNITQPGSYLFSVVMPPNMDNKTEIRSEPLRLNVIL